MVSLFLMLSILMPILEICSEFWAFRQLLVEDYICLAQLQEKSDVTKQDISPKAEFIREKLSIEFFIILYVRT